MLQDYIAKNFSLFMWVNTGITAHGFATLKNLEKWETKLIKKY